MMLKVILTAVAALPTAAVEATEVTGLPLVGLTAPAILGIFFIMWMRGDIVAGKVHRERVGDYKEEAERWRAAHTTSEEARATALAQVDRLNDGLRDMALSIKAAVRSGE